VGDGGDGTDDTEGGVLNYGQSVVTTEDLTGHELDAGHPVTEHLQFLNLVHQAADAGFFIFQAAEFFGVFDGDPANVRDGPFTAFHANLLKLLKGIGGSGDCFIDGSEDPVAAGSARARDRTAGSPELGDYLANNGIDVGIGRLTHKNLIGL
jgi:hypothetical protein